VKPFRLSGAFLQAIAWRQTARRLYRLCMALVERNLVG
jgi:hypothetical protein